MAEDRGPTPQFKRPAESPPPPDTSSTYRSARHSQALLGGLVALRDSGTLFDVVLVVEGKPIEAHRLLLAASCDYFRGMFAGGLREVKQEEVPIHGVSHSAMCKILNFIYTSELELSLADVQETLAAACQLQIPEVIGFCCDFLLAWVDEENILDVYRLAGLFHLAHLADQLDAYVLGHFPAFCRSPAYRRLPPDKVRSLLGSDRLRVDSEREVLTGVLLYHFPPEVADAGRVPPAVPPDLLDAVRFPLMDLASLRGLRAQLEPGPLRDRVAGALAYHRDEGLQPVRQSAQTELRSRRRCVVGFGGKHSTVLSNHARYLDPRAQEWRRLAASLGPLMSNQGVAVLNNFAFLVGGDNDVRGFHAEARCWRYDPRHNQWFQIQPLQRAHADLCVCVVGRFIYAIAGRDYHTDLKEVERYDPATDTWQYVAPLKGEATSGSSWRTAPSTAPGTGWRRSWAASTSSAAATTTPATGETSTRWPASTRAPASGRRSTRSRPATGSPGSPCWTTGSTCWGAGLTTAGSAWTTSTSTMRRRTGGRRALPWRWTSRAWPPASSPSPEPSRTEPTSGTRSGTWNARRTTPRTPWPTWRASPTRTDHAGGDPKVATGRWRTLVPDTETAPGGGETRGGRGAALLPAGAGSGGFDRSTSGTISPPRVAQAGPEDPSKSTLSDVR
ncbi:kelch-like protein 22 isoform X3 [Ornithorhynchus anatinus]|uniref:kelch-like protein 22 isoform X3 n=1 Tax=Ornithorhynchus anatinus TaxID=9258 RepID=UPI0019D49C7A|nr:kelch-like protein 22 isoform X3 [Ornithorhynchus anatinus]